jgi:hypothetical protein
MVSEQRSITNQDAISAWCNKVTARNLLLVTIKRVQHSSLINKRTVNDMGQTINTMSARCSRRPTCPLAEIFRLLGSTKTCAHHGVMELAGHDYMLLVQKHQVGAVLQIIYSDLCGPMKVASPGGTFFLF